MCIRDRPKRVFVEVTRGEGAKERTQSRKKQLEALYKSCKKDAEKIYEDYAELYAHLQKQDDAALRGKKLYLYFTQMGRCMYSGRRIDLADLFAEGYDICLLYTSAACPSSARGRGPSRSRSPGNCPCGRP